MPALCPAAQLCCCVSHHDWKWDEGMNRWRTMALLMPKQLKGVPWILSLLFGWASPRKRGCDAHWLLIFPASSCSVRKPIVAGVNGVGHNSSTVVMQIPGHNDTLSCVMLRTDGPKTGSRSELVLGSCNGAGSIWASSIPALALIAKGMVTYEQKPKERRKNKIVVIQWYSGSSEKLKRSLLKLEHHSSSRRSFAVEDP